MYLPSTLKAGIHEVRVVHPSGKAHPGQFAYPFKPGEHYCLLFPNATGLESSPSCAAAAP